MRPFTITKLRGGYAVNFQDDDGKRRRFQLSSKDKAVATAEAAEIVSEFFRITPDKMTVGSVLDAYIEHLGNRPAGNRLRLCRVLRDYFGAYRPAQITDKLVNDYCKGRIHQRTGNPVSDETLWTELGGLRDAINFAVKRKLISRDDAPYIPRPQKPAPRDRVLSRSEAAALLQSSKSTPHLFVVIALLLGTAGRISAILELTWDRVDFTKNVIDLRVNTTGPRKGRAIVPMNPGLRHILIEWKAKASQGDLIHNRVISFNEKPISSISTAFSKAVTRAELENVRVHDLRHTAAVWMLEAGSSIQRISQYLGHTTLDQTFKVYARYQPDFLRPEADALDVAKLLPSMFIGDAPSHGDKLAFPPMHLHSSDNSLSLSIDRADHPEFAAFFESRAEAVALELWREFLQQGA
jgi:integrase